MSIIHNYHQIVSIAILDNKTNTLVPIALHYFYQVPFRLQPGLAV